MLPDRVSNPGPLTYESGALLIALRGPAPKLKCANKSFSLSRTNLTLRILSVLQYGVQVHLQGK